MPAKPAEGGVNRLAENVADDDDYLPPPPLGPNTEPAKPKRRTRRHQDGQPGTATVYVSDNVSKRLEEYRRRKKGRTNLHVLIEAIEENHERLPAIIEESKVSTGPKSSVFPVDPKAVRYLGGGPIPAQFTPTPEQAKFLDEMGEGLGIHSRSTWIAPLLNAYLPGRKDTSRDTR